MMNLLRRYFLVPLSVSAFTVLLPLCPQAGAAGGYFFVEHVIDGDTVVIEGGEKVRYIGMDTPEAGEPFYGEAKKRNSNLVGGRRVRFVFCEAQKRDKYGRLLAWVYADGVFVNEILVKEGLARKFPVPPCGLEKSAEFRRAEDEARVKKLGLWSAGAATAAERYREGIKTIAPSGASGFIGQRVNVRGTVRAVKKRRDGVFLDFGGKDGFSAVIFKDLLNDLKGAGVDPMRFKGRALTVTGLVKAYRGRPEIVLKKPSDIKEE